MPEYRVIPYRGKFAVEWYENGRRFRRSLGTADRNQIGPEVRRIVAAVEAERRPASPTVEYVWHEYTKSLAGKPSQRTAQMQWRAAVGAYFGASPAAEITEEACREYTAARLALGRASGTVSGELGRLRSALLYAERKGLILKAPYIPRPPQSPPRDKWLTRDEAQRFLQTCERPHLRLFVVLAIATGARMGAILELTWEQIDFAGSRIDLGGRRQANRFKGRAVVPMNRMARTALLEAKERATGLWVIEYGGQKVGTVRNGLQGAGARCRLPWVTAHVFRHSAAVWMAQDRVPMSEIARYLGHNDSRTTERVYAKFSPEYLQEAAKSLDLDTDLKFNDTSMELIKGTNVVQMPNRPAAVANKIKDLA